MPAFAAVDPELTFPALEHEILSLWQRIDAFQRSVDQRPESSSYVFYDGPPFATGLPHYGHLVASTLKDIVPRYWAMRGHRVERRFGWDTHGLPVEMEMEKALGLNGPTSVRAFGVGKFNEECRANVLRFTEEWERVVGRLGRWVDFRNDYKTMDPAFMESVWWVFRRLWELGLVYKDRRVMPFSWRLSTALSNFEANMDYRDTQDPALTVKLPLLGDPDGAALLIWTTTPWTLPSNLAVAVGAEITYVRVRHLGQVYVVAEARRVSVLGEDSEVLATMTGRDLLGLKYAPLFPYFAETPGAFVVIESGHVTTTDGTGLVHMAPAFGEEDFNACRREGIAVIDPVDDEGRFTDQVPDYFGQQVKDADKNIIHDLKARGSVLKHETINHSYPFCWRSDTPLIYKTVPVWFIKVESLRDRMVQHNQAIHWVPDAVGSKRFGNWLGEARDWNVSRKRFWGTPLPIWICADCGTETCIGSIEELKQRTGHEITDLHPHKIDDLPFTCADCGGPAKRVEDVFDCWFESGAMPYAQVHYPFENAETFEGRFPAQFIAEGLDQTRGWFYTLLVLSTALFDRPPFLNCVVNGLVLSEDGSKMSKRKKNYPDPQAVLDAYGADALRAYLVNSPVVRAEPLKFSENGVREVVRTVLLPLRNAWSFFTQYANIDGWDPMNGFGDGATVAIAVSDRPELDRWILSVLQSLVSEVNTQMEGYYLNRVVPPMLGFIDHLTNWYIRRSRRRFWRAASDEAGRADKRAAYETLYEVLVTFAKVVAPVLPFISESLYQSLVVQTGALEGDRDSVHLCDYPQAQADRIDKALELQVQVTRDVVSLGRALREKHKLKTRQPLPSVTVVHHDAAVLVALRAHAELIIDELNVRNLELRADDGSLCTVSFKANFKTLGPRLGPRMKEAAAAISKLSRADFDLLQAGGTMEVAGAVLTLDDLLVQREARGDVVLESSGTLTVALDTRLDAGLIAEGHAREVVSRIQKLRKDNGLEVTDRIVVSLWVTDAEIAQAIETHRDYIASEVLAVMVQVQSGEGPDDAVILEGLPVAAKVEPKRVS